MMRISPIAQTAPCVVSHNLALGGAQTAVLRLISALPPWVRERTTLYSQSTDMPLLDAAVQKHGFSVGAVTHEAPVDPSCWVLSYGNLEGLAPRPTSLLLHSWDEEGLRYIHRAYGHLRGLNVAGVSRQVLSTFAPFIERGQHRVAGVLPPPVTEWCIAKGVPDSGRIVVAWMGRPLESKGLLTLPHLLKLDPRLVVRAWTGADTGGNAYTRRVQSETMEKLTKLAMKLKVADRLDIRPLDFDPLSYRHRLEGCHVLLGNSRREGFLLTAAEALSCGVPVVVTRTCGVSEFINDGVNGSLIEWDENPRRLARASYDAILRTVSLDPIHCLRSVRDVSLSAGYRHAHGQTLARLTRTSLHGQNARVTVGVRIHHPMKVEHLDQAISSLAMQSYRNFKTVLLVDGPWAWGEMLAERYALPLICTGTESDITHCSGLHRRAIELCDTEFYKPLDYDDQLLPDYLARAVATLDDSRDDVYGCLLLTLDGDGVSERAWPHKPIETMFTGNSNDNMLPHSSVLMRTDIAIKAGNYQEKAVGLGADDYHLWYRIHRAGGRFFRDDSVRNVVYRIHEKNSLKIRKSRYGQPQGGSSRGGLIAGATAASIAMWMAPRLETAHAMPEPDPSQLVEWAHHAPDVKPAPKGDAKKVPANPPKQAKKHHGLPDAIVPPHS